MKPMFCTPCYTGDVSIRHRTFCLAMQSKLMKLGVEPVFGDLIGSCFISWARHELTRLFLESDCTHLVFVDGDMAFDVDGFLRMLAFADDPKYKVIAAGYPMRKLDWAQIKQSAQNPDVALEALACAGQQWTLHILEHDTLNLSEPFEVAEIATGGMIIRREVFDVVTPPYFETQWDNQKDKGWVVCGEDYLFCQRYRALGGKVWLAPWVKSLHVGRYEFQGDMQKMDEAHR